MDPHHHIRISPQGRLSLNDRGVWLTEDQLVHERAMMSAVVGLQGTGVVFKGGSALALVYQLDRHATEIKFDASEPIDTTEIEAILECSMKKLGIHMSRFISHQDTDIVQQFKIHYIHSSTGQDRIMKMEIDFQKKPNKEDLTVIKGIQTYEIDALFDQKLAATMSRYQARDLHDIGFIMERYGGNLFLEQIRASDVFSQDYVGLAGLFERAFQDDKMLREIGGPYENRAAPHEDAALRFRIAVVDRLNQRGPRHAEQASSRFHSLDETLSLHRAWLATSGLMGRRANLAGADLRGSRLAGHNLSRANLRGANLMDAMLRGIALENADLEGVDFTDADLRFANLRGANLHNAILSATTLDFSDFTRADLTGVTMRRAQLFQTKGIESALAATRNVVTNSTAVRRS